VALVIIPSVLLLFTPGIDTRWDISTLVYGLIFFAGLVLLLAGMILLLITVYLFASVGEGTLAPWDPTEKLVIQGPYQYMRNPMITGVVTVLIGESVLTGSWIIVLWITLFFALNHVYFIFSEEPGLAKRFGEPYKRYKQNVPRWIPRSTPWTEIKENVKSNNLD